MTIPSEATAHIFKKQKLYYGVYRMPHTPHARMDEIAAGLKRARAAGHCSHEKREEYDWVTCDGGYEIAVQATCTECGKTATWDELEDDRKELIEDWT